ncbi:unnamed protein product [Notodromas monacha]|uniref:Ceramide transfer protein n=1 Tax=Notodromas monacha TaxID=399045 RepID=A0A7R9BHD4_9CRUS|nr:unnamed protein product [Notodromas monacha]CAG0914476.1 unnamed protein product [Notodromas monacha]
MRSSAKTWTHRRTASDAVMYHHHHHHHHPSNDHVRIVISDDKAHDGAPPPEHSGVLSKWTNYIHGWQNRFMVLRTGTLSYYKSETETSIGCRGAICISKAIIKPHELDECRFDVSLNDCVWYLRSESAEARQKWIEALEAHKAESGYGSQVSLRSHGSSLSIASSTFSRAQGLTEKLNELETYRDILCLQIDKLQGYFDACAEVAPWEPEIGDIEEDSVEEGVEEFLGPTLPVGFKEGLGKLDVQPANFRGESATFKVPFCPWFSSACLCFVLATSSAILTTLGHCIDTVAQREDVWRKRLEKEEEKRRHLEEMCSQGRILPTGDKRLLLGPDFEEGPHSALNEEEFFDAVETGLDKIEEEDMWRKQTTERTEQALNHKPSEPLQEHPLWPVINSTTKEQLKYALSGIEDGVWNLFVNDGPLRLYERSEMVDGLPVDPLKALHTVNGFTAKELCHIFFSPEHRYEVDFTVVTMNIVEKLAENCMVFHQTHKRVWPATQRDSLYFSYMTKVEDPFVLEEYAKEKGFKDCWIVCNHSIDHEGAPPPGQCIRVKLTACMVGMTYVDCPPGEELKREHLTCKLMYCAIVNPGGWVPVAAMKTVYKREYPRFVRTFVELVVKKTKGQGIML